MKSTTLFPKIRVHSHPVSGERIQLPNNNPFTSKKMASFYDRPEQLYTNIFKKIGAEEKKRFNKTLDVGCGTGISTRAAKAISDHVTGIDISEALLKRAMTEYPVDPTIEYIQAPAEALPFPEKTFDLVICCVSFHWLNQPQFLKEAARVLTDQGNLVICNYNTFKGLETADYIKWKKEVFFKLFPLDFPAKGLYVGSDQTQYQTYVERFQVTLDEFANLLMSTSGVINKIEKERLNPAEVKQFLMKELKPFFGNSQTVTYCIDVTIWTDKAPRPQLSAALRSHL